jgi:hypothetical protein
MCPCDQCQPVDQEAAYPHGVLADLHLRKQELDREQNQIDRERAHLRRRYTRLTGRGELPHV